MLCADDTNDLGLRTCRRSWVAVTVVPMMAVRLFRVPQLGAPCEGHLCGVITRLHRAAFGGPPASLGPVRRLRLHHVGGLGFPFGAASDL